MINEKAKNMEKNINKKGFKMPHVFSLMLVLILFATILTYIIPAGEYSFVELNGRNVIDPNTFTPIENTPVGLMGFLSSVQIGIEEAAYIIAFIFIIGGSFGVIEKTGALKAGLGKLIKVLAGKERLIIPILVFLIGLGSATFGMFEETLVLIPILIPLTIAMGFDSITGLAVAIVGTGAGYAGSFINAANVGTSQAIAGLPIFSGMGFRITVFIALCTISSIYIYYYAGKVKKNPTASLMYEFDKTRKDKLNMDSLDELTTARKLILIVLGLTLILLIFGVLNYGWYITELSALFLGMGIVVAIVSRMGLNEYGIEFAKGAASFTVGALVVGFARGILVVLNEGNILHTILYYTSSLLTNLPTSLTAIGMYIFQCFLNILIPSGSGQAMVSMPIMAPLADLVGITRQTACIAFQIGDGISNILTPTSGTFMVALALAKIPWEKWVKWFLPLFAMQFFVGAIMVLIANAINLGPF